MLTLLLGFGAVNTGNNLLYLLISALLGFMAMTGLLGHLNLKQVAVRVRSAGDHFAGRAAPVILEVTNPLRRWPLFLVRLQIAEQAVLVPFLRSAEKKNCPVSVWLPRRGYCALPEIQISSAFPVNFFIRMRTLPATHRVLVFPRPIPCRLPTAANLQGHPVEQRQASGGSGDELRSIEPFQAGDLLKEVHWKHSARSGQLQSKRFFRHGDETLRLRLDQFEGGLEERLGQLTYLICRAGEQGRPVALELPEVAFPVSYSARQRHAMLKALALYDSA